MIQIRKLQRAAGIATALALLLAGCSRSDGISPAARAGNSPSDSAPAINDDPPPTEADLLPGAVQALLHGCDLIDTANCLFPFPNDHFTVPAAPGSIQSVERGGTGRRVSIGIGATPRNVLGKPMDPAELNRNDGFSPGALIMSYVPELSLTVTYGLPDTQIGVVNPALSLSPESPIQVLEVPATSGGAPARHLVWGEIDANAGVLLASPGQFQGIPLPAFSLPNPNPLSALLIRPAKNFSEGRRYVVVLRNLKDEAGNALMAQPGFRACRDRFESALPPVAERCAELEANVFPVLEAAGIARDSSVYLAWDFTVASTQSQIGRLRHMRDTAFATLAGADDESCVMHRDDAPCAAPAFTVDNVTPNPREGIVKRIEGSITVPSFVVPSDSSPLEFPQLPAQINALCGQLPEQAETLCDALELAGGLAFGISLPPNRLYYAPAGGTVDPGNLDDPLGLRYGDGLPDRLPGAGSTSVRYLCQIPERARPDDPARAGIYGHGLLDSRAAVNYDAVPDMSREFNYMFCAVDWFGFSTGDLANVVLSLIDTSLFPVVPDASQQGFVNFMFLTRLLKHPEGFASHPEFQIDGQPVFDRSHVFYDGNSQGGILGGALMAATPDVTRGALGSLGMNYSTLLNRSKDYDQFALFFYTAYQNSLDRQLLYSLMQMLWDRSENNGYAAHLTDNSAFGGSPKIVKLDPQFCDHEVTEWSAQVMARTMGIPADFSMSDRVAQKLGTGQRHPDVVRGYGLEPLDYNNEQQASAGAYVLWDDERSCIPPIDNTPPRPEPPLDRNPHDDSAKKFSGRCQKAHFLREGGRLVDVNAVEFDGAPCPEVPPP